MRCNASGQPDPRGEYEMRDGRLQRRREIARDGEYISFDLALFDSATGVGLFMTDAKASPPASIDEALKIAFAEKAKQEGCTVADLLARMQQREVEDMAADVAKAFMSAIAGRGVAAKFADSADCARQVLDAIGRLRSDAAYERMVHDQRHSYLGRGAPAFSEAPAGDAEARVASAYAGMIADMAASSRRAA